MTEKIKFIVYDKQSGLPLRKDLYLNKMGFRLKRADRRKCPIVVFNGRMAAVNFCRKNRGRFKGYQLGVKSVSNYLNLYQNEI